MDMEKLILDIDLNQKLWLSKEEERKNWRDIPNSTTSVSSGKGESTSKRGLYVFKDIVYPNKNSTSASTSTTKSKT